MYPLTRKVCTWMRLSRWRRIIAIHGALLRRRVSLVSRLWTIFWRDAVSPGPGRSDWGCDSGGDLGIGRGIRWACGWGEWRGPPRGLAPRSAGGLPDARGHVARSAALFVDVLPALACGLCYVRPRDRKRLADMGGIRSVTFAMLMTRWTDPHFVVPGIGLHGSLERWRTRPRDRYSAHAGRDLPTRGAGVVAAYVCYSPFF